MVDENWFRQQGFTELATNTKIPFLIRGKTWTRLAVPSGTLSFVFPQDARPPFLVEFRGGKGYGYCLAVDTEGRKWIFRNPLPSGMREKLKKCGYAFHEDPRGLA